MTLKQGNKHMYMFMDTDFNERGTVKLSMARYIDDYIDEFPEDVATPVVSPSVEHVFKINTSGVCLSEEQDILLHRLVIKLMFVSMRDRPYTHPTIDFLTTRVQEADKND